MEYQQYRRIQIAELRPYIPGEPMDGISISAPDKENGSPKVGDMIARNPANHDDKWVVAEKYFNDNFAPAYGKPETPAGDFYLRLKKERDDLGTQEGITMDKETSPHVSSIAGLLIGITGGELWNRLHPDDHAMGNARSPVQIDACDKLAQEIRTLAGSCTSQDETPGQEKTPDDFYLRLKKERDDLDERLIALNSYLTNNPGRSRFRSMLEERFRSMSDLLAVLDERICDIDISRRSSTENDHAE